MDAYFDKEKLSKLIKSVYNITGITISIYDKNFKIICLANEYMCPFCQEVRKNSELTERCFECDIAALKKCKETKLRYEYKCHMALMEIATPILYNGEILGFILFGQISNQPDIKEIKYSAMAAAKELGFSQDMLLSSVPNVRILSNEYIRSVSDVVKMAAEYIVLNKMLSYKDDIGKQIENYINSNLKEELTVGKISKEFGICSTTLYNISVANFGCGIKEYIGKCKIELAKQMLDDKKSLKYVAEEIGFLDVNYFVRFFKSKTGITPKKYAEKH